MRHPNWWLLWILWLFLSQNPLPEQQQHMNPHIVEEGVVVLQGEGPDPF